MISVFSDQVVKPVANSSDKFLVLRPAFQSNPATEGVDQSRIFDA